MNISRIMKSHIIQIQNKNKKTYQDSIFIAADLQNNNIEKNIPFHFIDITNQKSTYKTIVNISPDVIILTAAMTDVDQNEIDKDLAIRINTEGPKNVLAACKEINSKLIFMSTDFVFDGKNQGNYSENDLPNPLSHYAKTKYDAEQAIINSEVDYLICRTAVLYGWNPNKMNFITWIIDKLQKNEKIRIVTSQINNPTYVKNLAEIILTMIVKNSKGIYHTAGNGALSRYEMALKCAEVFNFNKNLITPINNMEQKASRPENAGMDISKLKRLLGPEFHIFSLEEGLRDMKNNRDL
jgi:dTDP-4-dehydrorhamnose reductase